MSSIITSPGPDPGHNPALQILSERIQTGFDGGGRNRSQGWLALRSCPVQAQDPIPAYIGLRTSEPQVRISIKMLQVYGLPAAHAHRAGIPPLVIIEAVSGPDLGGGGNLFHARGSATENIMMVIT